MSYNKGFDINVVFTNNADYEQKLYGTLIRYDGQPLYVSHQIKPKVVASYYLQGGEPVIVDLEKEWDKLDFSAFPFQCTEDSQGSPILLTRTPQRQYKLGNSLATFVATKINGETFNFNTYISPTIRKACGLEKYLSINECVLKGYGTFDKKYALVLNRDKQIIEIYHGVSKWSLVAWVHKGFHHFVDSNLLSFLNRRESERMLLENIVEEVKYALR